MNACYGRNVGTAGLVIALLYPKAPFMLHSKSGYRTLTSPMTHESVGSLSTSLFLKLHNEQHY